MHDKSYRAKRVKVELNLNCLETLCLRLLHKCVAVEKIKTAKKCQGMEKQGRGKKRHGAKFLGRNAGANSGTEVEGMESRGSGQFNGLFVCTETTSSHWQRQENHTHTRISCLSFNIIPYLSLPLPFHCSGLRQQFQWLRLITKTQTCCHSKETLF